MQVRLRLPRNSSPHLGLEVVETLMLLKHSQIFNHSHANIIKLLGANEIYTAGAPSRLKNAVLNLEG